ncbi:MAG: hypothetical protein HY286_01195 [Planctomycetes bacterium]|nr:hypothetical protein [Planctomycetota bacterium]
MSVRAIVKCDVNGDHHADIVTEQDNGQASAFLGDGAGILLAPAAFMTVPSASMVVENDTNVDGRPAVVARTRVRRHGRRRAGYI